MANIQHLYRGVGNPNDNPALELTGDAIGSHLYQDIGDDLSVWMSLFYEEGGQYHHAGWDRMTTEYDLAMMAVEHNEPRLEGQIGIHAGETLFIAMRDPMSDDSLRWRSTGIAMGDWCEPALPAA